MTEKQNDWKLKELKLEFNTYGEYEGKYTGKVRFLNGEFESFEFRIRPEMAEPYIDLIAADVVKGAESLGIRLIESLGLKDRMT
jgi:hypothetical protein